ncbi:hypothetical protein D6774_01370 [Candidatus Woesearchaeota archaeon]|nr:MAG: hypothetical protein D6774_01370 [Candidatus Woesearchaeota archaeon]
MNVSTKGVVMMVFATLLAAFAQFLGKIGVSRITTSVWSIIFNPYLVSSLLLLFFMSLIVTFALRLGDVSKLYPLISLSFIWTAIVSSVLLGETLHFTTIVGTLIILLGVMVINSSPSKEVVA